MGTKPHMTGLCWETSLCKSAVASHPLLYSTSRQAFGTVLGKSCCEVNGCKDNNFVDAFLEFGAVKKEICAL